MHLHTYKKKILLIENIINNTLTNTLLFKDRLANYSGRTNISL